MTEMLDDYKRPAEVGVPILSSSFINMIRHKQSTNGN